MTITQVIDDGIEFFTIDLTGESGMSESGLARLCGVHRKAIQKLLFKLSLATSPLAECLEPYRGKDLELRLRGKNNHRIIRSDVCAAIIEYYTYEARIKQPQATFAFRKFAKLGIERWIQGITGWQPTLAEPTIAQLKKSIRSLSRSQLIVMSSTTT
ncbi:MAG: hypothetical protein HC805_01145 [Alkalinema sp. RL_2_19]|nr:hypothetical protein [Alkalinema sp. RL_2_19]